MSLLSDTDRKRLQSALDKDAQGLDLEEVEKELLSGAAQLWKSEGATVVTQISADMNIWLYAGNTKEMLGLDKSAEAYARQLGLKHMMIWGGRKGWKRILKPLGYIEKTILVKEL